MDFQMTTPAPLTDAEIAAITCVNFEEAAQVRAIEAEVNARWLKMMKEQEPAGWRVPHDGYGKSAFTNGLPSQETIDYWRNQGVELEYAYTHPAPPVSAEPVAWLATMLDDVAVAHKPSDIDRHPERWIPCYAHPAPQGCELNSRPLAWIGGNCGTSFTQSLERAEKWKRKGLECVPLYRKAEE